MQLYAHNQTAYEAAASMLESCRCAAVIHPTGTGKSFLAFQLIVDHPDARFLWLSPNDYNLANGDLLVPDSFMIGGFDLGKWVAYQLNRRKSGKLPADRVARIEEIGMVWDVFDACWGFGSQRREEAEPPGKEESSCRRSRSVSSMPSEWLGMAHSIPSGRVPMPGQKNTTGRMAI